MKFIFILLSLIHVLTSEAKISEEIYFHHYARDHPDTPIQLKTGEALNKNINTSLPWKFFIHGWTTSPWISPWFQTGKAAYFEHGDYNVVFVDWSKPANKTYLISVMHAMDTGKVFGKFIAHLNKNGVSLDAIHLLGHSLGSHMAGFTGKYLRDNLEKIGRITGLDPAGPFYETNPIFTAEVLKKDNARAFENAKKINPNITRNDKKFLVPPSLRLSDDDAKFVDIIHTDALHYGIESVIGHCDFFPNSGYPLQPGCEETTDINCSHARSVTFFVESINRNEFIAWECSSYEEFEKGNCNNNKTAVMGEHTDHTTRGVYYLKTNAQPPYSQGLGHL